MSLNENTDIQQQQSKYDLPLIFWLFEMFYFSVFKTFLHNKFDFQCMPHGLVEMTMVLGVVTFPLTLKSPSAREEKKKETLLCYHTIIHRFARGKRKCLLFLFVLSLSSKLTSDAALY